MGENGDSLKPKNRGLSILVFKEESLMIIKRLKLCNLDAKWGHGPIEMSEFAKSEIMVPSPLSTSFLRICISTFGNLYISSRNQGKRIARYSLPLR